MDPRFYALVVEQLRTLLAEEEAGQQPSNPTLAEAVYRALRRQNPDL